MYSSIGHPPGGCLQKNFPAAKQSWNAVQQQKRVETKKTNFTTVSR